MYAPQYPLERPKTAPPGWVDVLAPVLTQTLVVGGEASFVTRKLTPRLTRHGLYVAHHWPWKKQNGSFPENIGAVFVLTDMCGHMMSGAAIAEAHKRGIPVIMATRKHAVNIQKLTEAGFPEIPMLAPKPIVSKKETPAPLPPAHTTAAPSKETPDMPATSPTVIRRPRAPINPASPASTQARTSETVSGRGAASVSPVPAKPGTLPAPVDARVLKIMRTLAMSPGISNRRAMEELPNLTRSDVLLHISVARETLGIRTGAGKQLFVDVDAAIFNAACDRYNLDRVKIPADGRYAKENLNKSEKPAPRTSAATSRESAPAPVVTAVPKAEVSPEVLAATPANVQPPVQRAAVSTPDMKDLKDAVALLRAVMAHHNVESMTITATKADMRRIVVLDQSLDD